MIDKAKPEKNLEVPEKDLACLVLYPESHGPN